MGILNTSARAAAIALAFLCAGAAQAGPVQAPLVYAGTFTNDDDRRAWIFDLPSAATFHAFTASWANGGFAPVLTLFGGAGGYLQAAGSANNCGPGSGDVDPATGFCWDASLSAVLPAGSYTLVLSQDGNQANGPALADGFSMDGLLDYTSQFYLGTPDGRCVNVDATQRSCDYLLNVAVDLIDEPANPVPEPGTLALFGAALLGARRLRRRT